MSFSGITSPRKGQLVTFFVLFVLFYLAAVLIHLDYLPLNGDEPRRAIVSIEMMHSGNFIHPTTMGWEYYNKPPVYNWLISICMYLAGSSGEIPVRLPSLIFILVWGFCNYHIVKRVLPSYVAALSSLFLVTSFDIFFWGLNNGGEIDIFYSFIVYLQVISIFYFNYKKKWLKLFIASYIFCAIGFLTKGFPSLLFEGLTLLALCVYNRSLRVVFRWQHLIGLAVLFGLTGAYFYAYSFYGSVDNLLADLLKEAFNKSAFGEFSETLPKKMISYPVNFFKILLPWSLIPFLLFKKHKFRLWADPLTRFSLLFILFNIPVYWFTGHPRMRYVYMFLPFALIIFAYIFYKFKEEFPAFIYKLEKNLLWVFLLVMAGLIAFPFIHKVNYAWLSVMIFLLLLFFIFYMKIPSHHIWLFCSGIVLLRLIYALLLIPVRYESVKPKYDQEMADIAALNKNQAISIYKKPDMLGLVIDLKISKINFGSIPAIPYMAYQMPYYYYYQTGQVVQYDTVLQPNKNYIGFRSSLRDVNADILYSFKDNNQGDDVVLFRTEKNVPDSIK